MVTVAILHLVVGGILVVLARRNGNGDPLGLSFVTVGFLFAQLGTAVVALQYAAWAVLVVSATLAATAIPRSVWASSRRELLLAGATTVAVWLTYFARNSSRELVVFLTIVTAALSALLVVVFVVRAQRLTRHALKQSIG